jgi:hypothetical protein
VCKASKSKVPKPPAVVLVIRIDLRKVRWIETMPRRVDWGRSPELGGGSERRPSL